MMPRKLLHPLTLMITIGTILALPANRLLAHAELRSAVPAPGQNLTKQPEEIRLTFSEEVGPGSTITLYAEGFREITGTAASPDPEHPEQLVTAVPNLDPGVYAVQWLVLSTDGHPASGSYTFQLSPSIGPQLSPPLILALTIVLLLIAFSIWHFYFHPKKMLKNINEPS